MATNSTPINPDIVKRTKGSLGALITKPALTDKLLGKPPFRFLHDIMTEILRNTGFMRGLFTEEEMYSEKVKDKEKKLIFLQKVIDVLMFATGQKLKVKPSRIVAGSEPERTNEMLQLIAYCVQKKIDSSDAVKRVLKGEKPFSGQEKAEEKVKQASSQRELKEKVVKKPEQREDENELPATASHIKLPENESRGDKPPDPRGEADRKKRGERAKRERRDHSEEEVGKKRDSSEDRHKKREVHEERPKRGSSRDSRRPLAPEHPVQRESSPTPQPDKADQYEPPVEASPPNPRQRPASAKRSRRHEAELPVDQPPPESGSLPPNNSHISMTEGDTDLQLPPPAHAVSSSGDEQEMDFPTPMMSRPPIRPSTARRAPPKRRESSQDGIERILSGKEGPKVILDSEQDVDDTEEQFILQDNVESLTLGADRNIEIDESQQGALTRKLFDTKRRLEGDNVLESDQVGVNEAQKHKQKEVVKKEIEQMQHSIQSICQNVSPLSKIIDFIHEDLESMRNELDKWKKESEKHSAALQKEDSITEESLVPYREELGKIDVQIEEMREDINMSRYNYYQNQGRIEKLIESIAFASHQ